MDDLIKKKEDLITNSWDAFKAEINNVEERSLAAIIAFLKSKNVSQRSLSSINKFLKKELGANKFASPVRKFLKNFDDVERLSKKLNGLENDLDLSEFDLSDEKALAIEDVVNGLLNPEMVNAKIHAPLRKILYRYSTTNFDLKQAEQELKIFIVGNESSGFVERYVRPLAIESLSRFDGTINQKVATEFKLDGFRIVGSNIATTQPQCLQMTREVGELGQFAVNGKYAMADLPKIVEILKARYPGVYKGLTKDNFFIYRNHWGCRHQFIPTRLLKRDLEELARRNSAIEKGENKTKELEIDQSKIPSKLSNYEKKLGININKQFFSLLKKPIELVNKSPLKSVRGAYFHPTLELVHIPFDNRRKASKWYSEAVVYHEFGHAIDHQKGFYKSKEIAELMNKHRSLINKDFKKYIEIDQKLDRLQTKAYEKSDSDTEEKIGAIRDTLMALNQRLGMGHSSYYWSISGNKEREFIAHMFENKFIGNNYFKRYLPDLYKDMQEFKL